MFSCSLAVCLIDALHFGHFLDGRDHEIRIRRPQGSGFGPKTGLAASPQCKAAKFSAQSLANSELFNQVSLAPQPIFTILLSSPE